MARKTTWAHVQMLVIAVVFVGPLLAAAVMYYSGRLQPEGRVNTGALLEPIVNLAAELPDSPMPATVDGKWVLVYLNSERCDDGCRNALYTTRQLRLMLGPEMERLTRLFLHGSAAPDTVFIEEEHSGLITAENAALARLLNNKKPAQLTDGGFYLVDPLGNLVMYFQPDDNPGDIVQDLKRLLKLSRIG